ncbi:MAG: HNH endonuclease [Candidatus Scalindua sp.]|nr:HNH endonuclease [Candidatus Scalindua sp.]
MSILFTQNPDIEYLWSREIEYKIIGKGGKKKVAVQREPIGLSKRYTVMKRDGFQCVLCGASGMESQLEIDHIIPVSAGGMNAMDNLRTLCFKCNRGKRDQIE